MFKGKRVVIFGGLGLIGSSTARALIREGAKVTIADNRMPGYGANDFNIADIKGNIHLAIGDIRNSSFVNELVKEKHFIFNFAAQVNHNKSIEDPLIDNELNCVGHLNVLMACKNINKDAKLVYPGSRLQYGKIKKLPVKENHPREPLSIYAVHKNTAEQYYHAFFKHYGIPSVCLRISNPYGPRAQMKHGGYSIVNWFIRLAMDNKPIHVFGEGTQLRDYLYIDDLVEIIIRVARSGKTNGLTYNVGFGKPYRFIDMANLIVKIVTSGKIEFREWPKSYEQFETGDYYPDITSIKKDLGWEPKIDLPEGITRAYEYYKRFRFHYW